MLNTIKRSELPSVETESVGYLLSAIFLLCNSSPQQIKMLKIELPELRTLKIKYQLGCLRVLRIALIL